MDPTALTRPTSSGGVRRSSNRFVRREITYLCTILALRLSNAPEQQHYPSKPRIWYPWRGLPLARNIAPNHRLPTNQLADPLAGLRNWRTCRSNTPHLLSFSIYSVNSRETQGQGLLKLPACSTAGMHREVCDKRLFETSRLQGEMQI